MRADVKVEVDDEDEDEDDVLDVEELTLTDELVNDGEYDALETRA